LVETLDEMVWKGRGGMAIVFVGRHIVLVADVSDEMLLLLL